MLFRSGLAAMPMDSDGVPFNMSHIYASGNVAADMHCNVAAEATGRVLAVRLYNAAHDEGMKKMLHYMIARDTMHQQQWLAVIEELGGHQGTLPIPNSFPQEAELVEVSYDYFFHGIEGVPVPEGRFTQGASLDGRDEYRLRVSVPMGEEPRLEIGRAHV